jgi:death-on-curing protein
MNEPLWISREVLLATHEGLIERFGGLAGMRDDVLLDSALNRPRHLFNYGEPSIFAMAAVYAAGIIKNHPFLDGNKRTGFMAAYIFLGANGLSFQAAEESVVERTLALAAGAIGEADYAAWLEQSCGGLSSTP